MNLQITIYIYQKFLKTLSKHQIIYQIFKIIIKSINLIFNHVYNLLHLINFLYLFIFIINHHYLLINYSFLYQFHYFKFLHIHFIQFYFLQMNEIYHL